MCVIIFENRTPLKPVLRNVCIVYLSITGKEQTQSNRDFFFFFFLVWTFFQNLFVQIELTQIQWMLYMFLYFKNCG